MDIHGPLGYALHEGAKLTHFRDPTPPQYPARQSLRDYLISNLKGFDPRTPSGAFNLATTFIPGKGPGKGLTAMQQRFLNQLKFRNDPIGGNTPGKFTTRGGFERDQSTRGLVDLMGYTTGFPVNDLWSMVAREGTRGVNPAAESGSRVGLGQEPGYSAAGNAERFPQQPPAQGIPGPTLQSLLNQILYGSRRN